jgi:hypothetical protein
MNAPLDTKARSSLSAAIDSMDSRLGPQWLRWPIAALLMVTAGGAGAAAPSVLGEPAASVRELDELAESVAAHDREISRIERETANAYDIGVLALEISISGHKELTRLIVDVAKLDHPDFDPDLRDDQLNTRIIRGGQLLQTLSAPQLRNTQ